MSDKQFEKIKKLKKHTIELSNELDKKIIKLSEELSQYINFEYALQILPADGLVIFHENAGLNLQIDECLKIIKRKGELTEEDMLESDLSC